MPAPDLIRQLVQRFAEQQDSYRSKNYTAQYSHGFFCVPWERNRQGLQDQFSRLA